MSEIFLLNKICSEGPISIIKFKFYEGPIMFAGKLRLPYLIKSKFYEVSEFFLLSKNCSEGPINITRFYLY